MGAYVNASTPRKRAMTSPARVRAGRGGAGEGKDDEVGKLLQLRRGTMILLERDDRSRLPQRLQHAELPEADAGVRIQQRLSVPR
eukprot:6302165-Pyramimonas_sp.AAC.1